MSEVKFEITVKLSNPYGDDSVLDNPLPTEEEPNRTVKDVFKAELEERFKAQANLIKGDIQSIFVSSQVTDL